MTDKILPKPVAGALILLGLLTVAFGLLRLIVVPLDIKVAALVLSLLVVSALAAGFGRAWINILHDILQPVCVSAMLIGVTQMLVRLDDPALIGPAYAIAMLAPLYGLVLAGITEPWRDPNAELQIRTGFSVIALIALWVVMLSAIFNHEGALTFLSTSSLCLVIGGVLFFAGIDLLKGEYQPGRWRNRLIGLGAIGLIGGSLVALGAIAEPKKVGGAMAFSLLTMLYALMLLVSARIVFPNSVLKAGESSMGLGLTSLTVPVWVVSLLHLVVLVLTMMEP